MAFTSVNHDGVAEPGLEMKNDWGLCVVGNYDLIEVSGGGDMEDDSRLFALSLYAADLTNPLERFDSGRVGRKSKKVPEWTRRIHRRSAKRRSRLISSLT